MKKIFWSLFYLSILFLLIYLYRADYFKIPHIHSYSSLFFSFFLLLLGHFILALNWKKALNLFAIRVSLKVAFISTGLSIFMKYIPGKVMSILGRASYVSLNPKHSLKLTSVASILDQVIILWLGILFGSIILFYLDIDQIWKIATFLLFSLFTVIIFRPTGLGFLLKLAARFKKSPVTLPAMTSASVLKILPVYIVTWIFFSTGFYFFSISLQPEFDNLLIAFVLPLSVTMAMISLIAPGGLGIREGILSAGLTLFGMSPSEAITVSVASRLWFLAAELLLFLAAFITNRMNPSSNE